MIFSKEVSRSDLCFERFILTGSSSQEKMVVQVKMVVIEVVRSHHIVVIF